MNERGIELFRPFNSGTVIPTSPVVAGDSSKRLTNYGRIVNVYGPGRTSKDVLRDLDRMI